MCINYFGKQCEFICVIGEMAIHTLLTPKGKKNTQNVFKVCGVGVQREKQSLLCIYFERADTCSLDYIKVATTDEYKWMHGCMNYQQLCMPVLERVTH